MAYTNGLSERMDGLRYGAQRSSADESNFAGFTTSRPQSSFFSSFQQPSGDARGSLQRRFTTDSSKVSTSPVYTSQYTQMTPGTLNQQHLVDSIREQKRLAEAQLKMLELQEQSLRHGGNARDLEKISQQVKRISINGPVSEPTTPPEYADTSYSNRGSRSYRYSMNNLASPPGFGNRYSLSSTRITSAQGNPSTNGLQSQAQKVPAKSMPGSRRGSDEEEDYAEELPVTRSAASLNRFSMPINSMRYRTRASAGATPGVSNGLGPLNTTSFLFDDNEHDEKHLSMNAIDLTSPVAKAYAQLGGDDTFPILRSDGPSGRLSANSAALDLAKSAAPDADAWLAGNRYRPAHQSMPHTDSSMYRPVLSNLSSPPAERNSELSAKKSLRHSTNVTFDDTTKFDPPTTTTTSLPRPGALQTSYSTNDVPTLKNTTPLDALVTPPKTAAEQQFHNHNMSLGRIPSGGVNARQSRDLSSALSGLSLKADDNMMNSTLLSNLQASAAPFGPAVSAASDNALVGISSPPLHFNVAQNYSPHNIQPYSTISPNASMGIGSPMTSYNGSPQNMMSPYGNYGQFPKAPDSQSRRRGQYGGDESRYNNMPLESYRGNIYELCKDQHGCRYLQRRLEEGNPEQVEAIFQETCPHIVDLMTDPFGNYLCQKLLEHCNNAQRTSLIATAAPSLPVVALNQHGTRALQKMIEFINTDEQVQTIVFALSERVVELVQDLNGNHVIQKCLNKLGAEKCQFIYDAVGVHCVVVGTHRHGCCVLQRCIDHASGFQRAQLISRITHCAFDLVQDPFGNYVIQYILDLDEPKFTKPICEIFVGKVFGLSKQKFSSNVIEKCIRVADPATRQRLILEILEGGDLDKMLRDSFANYVVQTALEYADETLKQRLIDQIRPVLPAIKQTPHGRRIAGKVMALDGTGGRSTSGSSSQLSGGDNFTNGFSSGRAGSGRRQVQIVGGGFNTPRHNNAMGPEGFTPAFGPAPAYAAMNGHPNEFPEQMMQYGPPPGHQPGMQGGYPGYNPNPFGNNYI